MKWRTFDCGKQLNERIGISVQDQPELKTPFAQSQSPPNLQPPLTASSSNLQRLSRIFNSSSSSSENKIQARECLMRFLLCKLQQNPQDAVERKKVPQDKMNFRAVSTNEFVEISNCYSNNV
jgi:hypothetical protein